MFFVSSDVKRR